MFLSDNLRLIKTKSLESLIEEGKDNKFENVASRLLLVLEDQA